MTTTSPGKLTLWAEPTLMLDSDGWPCLVVGEWRHPVFRKVTGYAAFRASLMTTPPRALPNAMGVPGAPAAPCRAVKED